MPATNWPSAASFSDCVSRLRSSSRSASSLRLRRQVARDDHAADALALVIEQIGHRDHERPVQHRIDDLAASPAARRRRATRPTRACARASAPSSGPMQSASGRSSSCSRVLPDARRRTPGSRARSARARSETTTRCAIESNVFSSSRRDRITSSSSCMFSIGARELAPELVGAVEQVELAAGSTRTPSKTIVPSARRQPRSGTVTVAVGGVARRRQTISARARRMRGRGRRERIVGADADAARRRARDRTRPAARAGARADRESRPTCDRRRTAGSRRGRRCRGRPPGSASPTRLAENSSSSSRRSRCSSSLWRRRNSSSAVEERVGDLAGVAGDDARRRRVVEADGEQPDALVAARERQQQRRRRAQARARSGICRSASATSVGVARARTRRRRPPLPRRPGSHGSARSSSRPKPEVACSTPLRGLCSKSSEQSPPRHVERVLMQVRQQIDQASCVRASSDISGRGASGAGADDGDAAGRARRVVVIESVAASILGRWAPPRAGLRPRLYAIDSTARQLADAIAPAR